MKTCKEGANLQIPYFEGLVLTYLFYIRHLFSLFTGKEKKRKVWTEPWEFKVR